MECESNMLKETGDRNIKCGMLVKKKERKRDREKGKKALRKDRCFTLSTHAISHNLTIQGGNPFNRLTLKGPPWINKRSGSEIEPSSEKRGVDLDERFKEKKKGRF